MELSITVSAITIFLVVAVIFLYYYCRQILSYWSRHGVEQLPSPHWLFGHYKEGILLRASPGWYLGQLYKRARHDAPFVGFYIFHKPCLLIKDPIIIKEMLIKDANNFVDRNFAGNNGRDGIGMRNLFAARGKEWKYMRRKIVPVLTKSLKQMLPLMTQTGQPMLQYIKSNEGRAMDVQELSTKYAADLIARVALGTKTDSFHNPHGELARHLSEIFHSFKRMVAMVAVFFMPDVVNWTGSLLLFNTNLFRKAFWSAMAEREKSGEDKGDFIDFAKEFQGDPQNLLYDFAGNNLAHQAGTFLSGFESSASTATFALLELARHQEFQEQARADIRRAIEKHGWTNEAFREMRFLEQCLQEVTRMHPQVSTLDRVARDDYTIPSTNITLKKGTAVYVSLYGLHEDPQYFEDPGAFNPGRFHRSATPAAAYLPFGAGPRMCPGSKIGLLHVKVVISLILTNYEIHQRRGERLVLNPHSTLVTADSGLDIHFTKLNSENRICRY